MESGIPKRNLRILKAAPGQSHRGLCTARLWNLSSLSHQECVRRRAVLSVRANPACPDQAAAEKAVNEVWESCFNDTRPFDEVRKLPL